jgi:heavy metal-binding protein
MYSGAGLIMKTTNRYFPALAPLLFLVPLAACGSGVPPRPTVLDPSNPDAPESRPFSLSLGAPEHEIENGESSHATEAEPHVTHDHGAANVNAPDSERRAAAMSTGSSEQSTIYSCPMHPEVKSSQPGKCPKCGMKLVLNKEGQ